MEIIQIALVFVGLSLVLALPLLAMLRLSHGPSDRDI
jgi:hypothetical protein